MTSKDRWKDGLEAEKTYDHFERPGRAELERFLSDFQADESLFEDKWVLEVGAGNGPGYTIKGSTHNVGIDPFSHKKRALTSVARQSRTSVTAGLGEQLPFDANSFGVVICNNVLDHVRDPSKVITEMRRVLEPGGLLLLRVNVFPLPESVRQILDQIDEPHPHHFHPKDVVRLIEEEQLDIKNQYIHDQRAFSGNNFKKRIATGLFRLHRLAIAAECPTP